MASFNNITLTDAGRQLIAGIVHDGNAPLTFTSIGVGDGILEGSELPSGMTSLKREVVRLGIESFVRQEESVFLTARLSTDILEEDFYHRELGIYVSHEGKDILLAYGNAASDYDFIPRAGGNASVYKTIETSFAINELKTEFRDLPTEDLVSFTAFNTRIHEVLPVMVNDKVAEVIPDLLTIGTVETLNSACNATATLSFCQTSGGYFLDLGIPRGADGCSVDLSDYQGSVNIKDSCGHNILSLEDGSQLKFGDNYFCSHMIGAAAGIHSDDIFLNGQIHPSGQIHLSKYTGISDSSGNQIISLTNCGLRISSRILEFKGDIAMYDDCGCRIFSAVTNEGIEIGYDNGNFPVHIHGLCGSGSSSNVDLSNYQGPINIRDSSNNNIISLADGVLRIGSQSQNTLLEGDNLSLCSCQTSHGEINIFGNTRIKSYEGGSDWLIACQAGVSLNSGSIDIRGDIMMQSRCGSRILSAYSGSGGGIEIGDTNGSLPVTVHGFCGSGSSSSVDLSNYQGPINLRDQSGRNVLSTNGCGYDIWIGAGVTNIGITGCTSIGGGTYGGSCLSVRKDEISLYNRNSDGVLSTEFCGGILLGNSGNGKLFLQSGNEVEFMTPSVTGLPGGSGGSSAIDLSNYRGDINLQNANGDNVLFASNGEVTLGSVSKRTNINGCGVYTDPGGDTSVFNGEFVVKDDYGSCLICTYQNNLHLGTTCGNIDFVGPICSYINERITLSDGSGRNVLSYACGTGLVLGNDEQPTTICGLNY